MDLLLKACCAYLIGTVLGPDFPILLSTQIILLICLSLTRVEHFQSTRKHMLLITVLGFGLFLSHLLLPPSAEPHKGKIEFSGTVKEVSYLANRTRALVRSDFKPWPDHLLVLLPYNTKITPGDFSRFRGEFLPSKNASMSLAMATKATRGTVVDTEIIQIYRHGEVGPLQKFKQQIENKIITLHPGDRGGLLVGLLTGSRSSLSNQTKTQLQQTGLTHIIAISGANFVLILGIFAIMLKGLSAKMRIVVLAPVTVTFWLFVGGGMAVSRAAITVLFTLLAEGSGRRNGGYRALIISATFLAIINPLAPRADASFQLSVLATAGVLIATKLLSRYNEGLLSWKTTFVTAICTTLATFPVQLGIFGSFPIVSPLTNLFALPMIPVVMAAGAAEIVFNKIPILNIVLHGLTEVTAGYILSIAKFGSKIPFSTIELPEIPAWLIGPLLILTFGSMLLLLIRIRPRHPG